MTRLSNVVFAHDMVGFEILRFLLSNYRNDIDLVVLTEPNDRNKALYKLVEQEGLHWKNYQDILDDDSIMNQRKPSYIFLCWWPTIVPESVINWAENCVINTHPSLLPYCRGKDPNFWAIKESVPFGVSMHVVTTNIDDGPILFQKNIPIDWEDTGKSIYQESLKQMIALFIDSYPQIRSGQFIPYPNDKNKGSLHLRSELDKASEIDLEKKYKARDLINLLRARTFPPYPGSWFMENGEKYEININIKKANRE